MQAWDEVAPPYEQIAEDMRKIWEDLGKPNPELFAYAHENATFNQNLRGKRAVDWTGWVISAESVDAKPPYPFSKYNYVDISMDGPRRHNGEAPDVMLNRVSDADVASLLVMQDPTCYDGSERVVLRGTITAVQYDGSVSLEEVSIRPVK